MIALIKDQRMKHPKFCEIIRFLIVGGIATIIDMLVMASIIYFSNRNMYPEGFLSVFLTSNSASSLLVVLATAIGFIIGLIFNYIFSIIYVYDNNNNYAKSKKGFILFSVLSAIGLLIQSLGMFLGYSVIGINEWIVKIILVLVVLIFNYITRKIFIFNKNDKKETATIQKNKIKKDIEKITKKSIVLNVLFVVSSFALCLLMYNPKFNDFDHYLKYMYAIASSGITGIYLFVFNKNILSKIKIKEHLVKLIFVITYTLGITYKLLNHTRCNIKFGIVFSFLSIFAIFCYSYLLISFAIKFFKYIWDNLTNFNKKLFVVIILIGIVFNTFTFCFTNLFCDPGPGYDFFISFDTGELLNLKFHENQLNLENDFRHFIMSLCILPFSVIPSMISDLFSKIPAFDGLLLSYVQVFIISYCIVLIISLLKIENKTSIILFTTLFLVLSGTFYNMLTTEKFVFSLFYIITTIYLSIQKSPWKWIFFIGSLGILMTNIFLLPIVIFTDKKPFKDWLSELIVAGIIFVCILILSGQFNLLLHAKWSWDSLKRFSTLEKSVSTSNTIMQTLIFIASMILSPLTIKTDTVKLCQPSINFMCIIGALVIIANIISFIINHKNKYAIICFYWQLFMLFLLIGIGWGAILNEMFIYSALFTWSTISLIYMLIRKIFKTIRAEKVVITLLISIISLYNSIEFIKLIIYAKDMFPSVFLI